MTTDVEDQLDDAAEQQEEVEGQEQQETHDEPAAGDVAQEVAVVFGDEETDQQEDRRQAPEWVKELRKTNRELARKVREMEAEKVKASAPQQDEVGKKPTLEDYEYDTEKYEAAYEDWRGRRDAVESRKRQQEEEHAKAQKEWEAKLAKYEADKGALGVADIEEAEEAVRDALSQTQLGILMQGADKPAELICGLGTNPAKLQELASIKDPVKFAFAVARLEPKVKTVSKKPPAPEKTITGTAPPSGTVDGVLERLRAEAEKTGDYSKVMAYKRKARK